MTGVDVASALVEEVFEQLQRAGVEHSDTAVRVLRMHAGRRELTRREVAEVLARFAQRYWNVGTVVAAAALLRDLGEPDRVSDVRRLQLLVAEVGGHDPAQLLPPWHVAAEVEQCTAHWQRSGGSCLHALAGGWIGATDLCPVCTRRFMAALDNAVPDLDWHENYRRRAAEGGEPS